MERNSNTRPVFYGYVATTRDASILFQACHDGALTPVSRRLHKRERAGLIRSGNVFIYTKASGIRRWTDGLRWSPTRVSGEFLLYRELDTGEHVLCTQPKVQQPDDKGKSLTGSFNDSFKFKQNGLVKKTVSVSIAGIKQTLVSYYKINDITSNKLLPPSKDPRLYHIRPGTDFFRSFGSPLDGTNPSEQGTTRHNSCFRKTLQQLNTMAMPNSELSMDAGSLNSFSFDQETFPDYNLIVGSVGNPWQPLPDRLSDDSKTCPALGLPLSCSIEE